VTYTLAVDGGNTKTLAVVSDETGRVIGFARGGRSDIYNAATPAEALEEIARAAAAALGDAGVEAAAIAASAFSLAGADWPEDFVLLERELTARIGLPATPLVVNDAIGALRAGSDDWTGIAVVAGTYNAVGARHPDGRVFHLGFWPDGAGGRNIADDGLRAVYRAGMGMGPATALSGMAFALYEEPDAIALLHAFTRRGGLDDAATDRFAAVVIDAADGGDAVARGIIDAKARILGVQARAAAAQLDLPLDGTRVVLTGGVFTHPSERLATGVIAELPGAVPMRNAPPPVAGALLLALDRAGVAVTAADVDAGLRAHLQREGRSARWAASASSA
jgi:N-acetylglucosamine kinase-like BadF-type ATPase